MSTAKLFNIAAIGFTSLGFLLKPKGSNPPLDLYSPLDLYVHDAYFVVSRWTVVWIAAVICALFGLLYFACGRWLRIPLNSALSLANFVLIVLPLAVLIWSLHSLDPILQAGSASRVTTFIVFHFFAPTICFLLGCLLFVVNFSWTLIRGLRLDK